MCLHLLNVSLNKRVPRRCGVYLRAVLYQSKAVFEKLHFVHKKLVKFYEIERKNNSNNIYL